MVKINLIDDIWEKQVKRQIARHEVVAKEYARKEIENSLEGEVSLLILRRKYE